MMGSRHRERDSLPFPEDRLHDVDIRNVHPPTEGIVHDEDISRLHGVAELLQESLHRVGDGSKMEGNGHTLRDHVAVGVTQ